MSSLDLSSLFITLKLAFVTTVILLIIGIPTAWWLSRSQSRFKIIIESIVAMPLILPPTVLGFYLLISLGPNGFLGKTFIFFSGEHLAFSFTGLVIGSIIYSMPFVIQPLHSAFATIDNKYIETAKTLGAGPFDTFINIVMPMSRVGIITATVLGFAHTIGEFGVVLMIGGNIPGKTQVLSISIYDHVEALEFTQAHILSGILLAFSFILLFAVYTLNFNAKKRLR